MNLLVLYTYGHDTFAQVLISKNIKIYSYKLKNKYTLNQTKKWIIQFSNNQMSL
jgi:hypothetical protein